MQLSRTTTYAAPTLPSNGRASARPPWPFALACCVYHLFVFCGLTFFTAPFFALFQGLGIALPWPTYLLMASHSWLIPAWLVATLTLTIGRQLVKLEGFRLRLTNFSLVFLGVAFAPLVILTLYLPLFALTWKLHAAR